MFVLDTDHLVILQKRSGADFANLLRRLSQYEPSAFFVTIVSFHELIGGWQQYLSKATSSDGVVRGYRKLETVIGDFAKAQVLGTLSMLAEVIVPIWPVCRGNTSVVAKSTRIPGKSPLRSGKENG